LHGVLLISIYKLSISQNRGFVSKISTVKASPFGSNGDDRRQRRKQGGAVGAAASRMQATAKQTLGAATRAVAAQQTERARSFTRKLFFTIK